MAVLIVDAKNPSRPIFVIVMAAMLLAILLVSYKASVKTLYYSGPISEKLLDDVQRFPIGKLQKIVIDSKGGNFGVALDIADIVQANNIQIIVDGYCLPACASIVLPAGKNNVVRPNSLVAFHNLPGLWFYLNKFTEAQHQISLKNDLVYLDSKRTIDLYRKANINPDLFVALTLSKGLHCLGRSQKNEPNNSGIFVNFDSDLIVPNEQIFEQFDWNFEEFNLPTNPATLEKLLAPMRADNPDIAVKILKEDFKYPKLFLTGDLGFTHMAECLGERP